MAYVKCSGGGRVATGSFDWLSNTQTIIDYGFKAKYLSIIQHEYNGSSAWTVQTYNADLRDNYFIISGGSPTAFTWHQFNNTYLNNLYNVTNTGFIVNKSSGNNAVTKCGSYYAM